VNKHVTDLKPEADLDLAVTAPPRLSALIWEGDRIPLGKALLAAQMASESIKKAASNEHFKTKYADLSHVVEGVVPALNNAGVVAIQNPDFDGQVVAVTTTLLHAESGSSITGVLHLRPSKADPQGVGSATTYARRYALLAMTGAAPEDDDGRAASGPGPNASNKPADSRRSDTPGAEEKAANLLKGCGSSEMLKDAWERNEKGWRGVMEEAAYLRLKGLCIRLAKQFSEADEIPF